MDFQPQPIQYQNAPQQPSAVPQQDTSQIQTLQHTPANMTEPFKMQAAQEQSKAATGAAQAEQVSQADDAQYLAAVKAWDASGSHGDAKRGTPAYFEAMINDSEFMKGLSPGAAAKVVKQYHDTKKADVDLDETIARTSKEKRDSAVKILELTTQLYGIPAIDAYDGWKAAHAKDVDSEDKAIQAMRNVLNANSDLAKLHPELGVSPMDKSKIATMGVDEIRNMMGVIQHMAEKTAAVQTAQLKSAETAEHRAKANLAQFGTKEEAALAELRSRQLDPSTELAPEQFKREEDALTAKMAGSNGGLQGVPEDQVKSKERNLAVNQWIQNPSSLRGMDKTYQRNVIKWASDLGITPEDVIGGRAQQKFQLSAATTAGHRAGTMQGVEAVIPKLITNAEKASAAVPRTTFVPWNKLSQMTEGSISDSALRQFKLANMALASEYQQVISRNGSNVTALKEAMDMLKTADSHETYVAALHTLEKEVKANKEGMDEVAASYGSKVNEKLTPNTVHTPSSKLSFKAPDGHNYFFTDQANFDAWKKAARLYD